LSSHIAFIAKSLGIDKCIQTGSNLIIIPPSLDPPSPIIHQDIKTIIITIKIEQAKITYRKKLIEAAWSTAKCADGKTQRFDLTKFKANQKKVIRKNFIDVETENAGKTKKIPYEFMSERTIKRFTTECLSENIILFRDIVEKFGFEEFKKAKIPNYVIEIVKITIEVIFTKSYELRGLLWHVIIKYFKDLTKVSDDQKIFMVLLFQYLERRVVSQLDLYDTYGLYGFVHTIYLQHGIRDIALNRKGINPEHNSFEGVFKLNKISEFKFIVDLYYLTYVAGRVTAAKIDVEDGEAEFTNRRNNAETQLPSLMTYILRGINKREDDLVKPMRWSFDGLEEQIAYCRRWKYFANSPTEKKEVFVDKYRVFVNGKADTSIKREQNDYSKCSTNFLKQMISELHTLPILLYAVPVFNGYNYFHKYFKQDSTKFIVDEEVPLAKAYRHLQTIRLNSDVQTSDIPNYILDKTSNCIENVKWNKHNNPNYDCYFTPKEYANLYWLFKFAFNVNYPHIHYDFNFFSNSVPIFGTTQLIMMALEHKQMNTDMKAMCLEIDIEEEEPNICKVFLIMDRFSEEFESNEESKPDTEGLFVELNGLAEKSTSEPGKILFRFLVLEAFKVIFNMNSRYGEVAETIKTDLSVDNLIFASQDSSERKSIRDSPIFDRFLLKENEKEAITVFGQYIYYTNVKRKYSESEKVLRKSIKAITELSVGEMQTLLTIDGHKAPDFYKYLMIYSPSIAASGIIAQQLMSIKIFLNTATLQIPKHHVKAFVEQSVTAECQKTPLECFMTYIVGETIDEEVTDLAAMFENDANIQNNDGVSFGEKKLGEELEFDEFEAMYSEVTTIEKEQKIIVAKQVQEFQKEEYNLTIEEMTFTSSEVIIGDPKSMKAYGLNLNEVETEEFFDQETSQTVRDESLVDEMEIITANKQATMNSDAYRGLVNVDIDEQANARIGGGVESTNSISMTQELLKEAVELDIKGQTSLKTIGKALGTNNDIDDVNFTGSVKF